jgi:cardiolipin synthase A/B
MLDVLQLLWSPLNGILGVLLAGLVSLHAILRRRDPRAVIIWMMVAWLAPLIGALLYYFFGINRIVRKAAHLRRKPPPPHSSPQTLLSRSEDVNAVSPKMRHLQTLSHLVQGVVDLPLTEGNLIRPLTNGDEAYPEMIKTIDAATSSVGFSTYIFNFDRAGQLFLDALSRAQSRGVAVRVLVDDVGSGFPNKIFRELKARSISFDRFLPTFSPWPMAYLNMRNHRKLLIVDGKIGYTGGMNVHECHWHEIQPKFPYGDIHFKLEGPVVAQLQQTFREDWFFTTGEVLTGPLWFPPLSAVGHVRARGIPDGPDEDFEKIRWAILGALSNARETVKIVTPYFVPDAPLITALNLAAMSGIKVDIVLPETNDLIMVKWASDALLWQVLERGCRVWMCPPPFEHSKLMLVDGGWTLFGSSNWDQRSMRLNFEFNVECYDEELTSKLEAMINEKIKLSREITLADMDSRPFPQRLRDGVARLFAPVL